MLPLIGQVSYYKISLDFERINYVDLLNLLFHSRFPKGCGQRIG